jgi:hypothetical protein
VNFGDGDDSRPVHHGRPGGEFLRRRDGGILNYFKYKSTIGGIVKSRVLVIGRSIENSVQASLSLGMQFTELTTLPALMEREKAADRLIRGIDVFDDTGQVIYSTESSRVGQRVLRGWTEAANRCQGDRMAERGARRVHRRHLAEEQLRPHRRLLALRYSRDYVDRAAAKAARRSRSPRSPRSSASPSSPARADPRDPALRAGPADTRDRREPPRGSRAGPGMTGSAFDAAINHLRQSLRDANGALDDLRAKLDSAS